MQGKVRRPDLSSNRAMLITTRFAWSQVQQEDWDWNSAEPSSNRKVNHWPSSLLMLTFNARGCTTLAVLDLKLSETEEAAVELAEYAAGISYALLLFISLIPWQNTLDLNQAI